MNKISYRRHRFPAEIIHRAVWLCFRFPLSYRDVEDLLAERGVDVSYETIRRWALKFGQAYARKLRQSRPRPDDRWHLDEVFSSINGKRMYLWRAVDSEGEVLDILVQSRRNKKAALDSEGEVLDILVQSRRNKKAALKLSARAAFGFSMNNAAQ